MGSNLMGLVYQQWGFGVRELGFRDLGIWTDSLRSVVVFGRSTGVGFLWWWMGGLGSTRFRFPWVEGFRLVWVRR